MCDFEDGPQSNKPEDRMVNYLLALLLIVLQVSLAQAQAQRQPPKKQQLNAEQVAATILPRVVLIEINCDDGRTISQGSGFFVSGNLIATNRHVVQCGVKGSIKLTGQQSQRPITSIYVDDGSPYDLALINVEGPSAKPLPLSKGQNITVGKTVYVAGNPRGLEGTFSNGIISGIRKDERVIQFTAPISPGSSGGPLINDSGEVIGVATAAVKDSQNLNFAVEISLLNDLIDKVQRGAISPKSVVKNPAAGARGNPNAPIPPVNSPNRRRKYEGGLRLMLLIDCSGSMKPVFSHVVAAGLQLINSLKDGDEAGVTVISNGDGDLVEDFTSDKQKLITALDGLTMKGGATTLKDTLHAVCDFTITHVEKKGGRPVIVMITDGDDTHSYLREQYLFSQLHEEEVPVYTIGLVNQLEDTPPSYSRISRRERAIKLLTEIGRQSGARAFFPKSLEELPENIREIAAGLHQPK
jgi:S1-C subfamily serine protease